VGLWLRRVRPQEQRSCPWNPEEARGSPCAWSCLEQGPRQAQKSQARVLLPQAGLLPGRPAQGVELGDSARRHSKRAQRLALPVLTNERDRVRNFGEHP